MRRAIFDRPTMCQCVAAPSRPLHRVPQGDYAPLDLSRPENAIGKASWETRSVPTYSYDVGKTWPRAHVRSLERVLWMLYITHTHTHTIPV
jgi:hypothetical protein